MIEAAKEEVEKIESLEEKEIEKPLAEKEEKAVEVIEAAKEEVEKIESLEKKEIEKPLAEKEEKAVEVAEAAKEEVEKIESLEEKEIEKPLAEKEEKAVEVAEVKEEQVKETGFVILGKENEEEAPLADTEVKEQNLEEPKEKEVSIVEAENSQLDKAEKKVEEKKEDSTETNEEETPIKEAKAKSPILVPDLEDIQYFQARYSLVSTESTSLGKSRTSETEEIFKKFGPPKPKPIISLESDLPNTNGKSADAKSLLETPVDDKEGTNKEAPKTEITIVKEQEVNEEHTQQETEPEQEYYTYETPPVSTPAYKSKFSRLELRKWKTIAGIGLGVLGVISIAFLLFKFVGLPGQSEDSSYLEAFESPETYNILLLPFKPYTDCKALEAFDETAVRDRLNLLQESSDLGIEVAFIDENACPSNAEEAKRIGKVYNANLVIWGDYPKVYEDSTQTHIRYIALDKKYETLASRIGHIGKQAFSDIYELQQGALSGRVDDIVYWALATVLLQSEDYLSSISYLEQIEDNEASNISIIHHMIAKCYQGLGKFDEVLTHYNKAIQLNPGDANAYYNRGRLFQRLRQNDQALADYAEAISINDKHLKAHYNRKVLLDGEFESGFYLEENLAENNTTSTDEEREGISRSIPLDQSEIEIPTGDFDESNEEIANNNFQGEKESIESMLSRGYQLERDGKIQKAFDLYSQAIEKFPNNSRAYFNRGAVYEKTGAFSKALQDYAKAIDLDKKNIDYFGSRAYLYERLKQYYNAIEDYSKIIKINPDKVDAYLYRGKAYQYVKRNQEALADFQEAIRRNPVDATGYYFRGKLYTTLGQSDNALSDLTQAVAINSGYASAYRDRGQLLLSRKRYEKALSDYNQVLSLNPHDAKVYIIKGDILLKLDRKEEAVESYKEALKLDPKNQSYQKILSKIAS